MRQELHCYSIATAAHQIAAKERELHTLVSAARADGVTWAEIALALGVTKQSAHEKFRTVPT